MKRYCYPRNATFQETSIASKTKLFINLPTLCVVVAVVLAMERDQKEYIIVSRKVGYSDNRKY